MRRTPIPGTFVPSSPPPRVWAPPHQPQRGRQPAADRQRKLTGISPRRSVPEGIPGLPCRSWLGSRMLWLTDGFGGGSKPQPAAGTAALPAACRGIVIMIVADAPYLVRWRDGHESVFFPSSGTEVEHHPAQRASWRRAMITRAEVGKLRRPLTVSSSPACARMTDLLPGRAMRTAMVRSSRSRARMAPRRAGARRGADGAFALPEYPAGPSGSPGPSSGRPAGRARHGGRNADHPGERPLPARGQAHSRPVSRQSRALPMRQACSISTSPAPSVWCAGSGRKAAWCGTRPGWPAARRP